MPLNFPTTIDVQAKFREAYELIDVVGDEVTLMLRNDAGSVASPGSGLVASVRAASGWAFGAGSGVGFTVAVLPGASSGPSVSGTTGGISGAGALGFATGTGGAK